MGDQRAAGYLPSPFPSGGGFGGINFGGMPTGGAGAWTTPDAGRRPTPQAPAPASTPTPAGGTIPPSPAGGALATYNPIPQPFGGPQIPGNPGAFWGPGSTYYAAQQGSTLPPEIINAQGNAYVYGPGGWEAGGVNAQAPSQTPAPAPAYAGANSIPGQQLNPFFGPQQQQALRAQLAPRLAGVTDPNAERQILDNQLRKFFKGMAPTSDLGAPLGGYVPGFQVPQQSLNYVPAGSEFGLEKQLLNRQPGQGLKGIIANWASGLGQRPGPAGFNVPVGPPQAQQSQGGGGK